MAVSFPLVRLGRALRKTEQVCGTSHACGNDNLVHEPKWLFEATVYSILTF